MIAGGSFESRPRGEFRIDKFQQFLIYWIFLVGSAPHKIEIFWHYYTRTELKMGSQLAGSTSC